MKNGSSLRKEGYFSRAELIALGAFVLLSLCCFMFVYDLWHTATASFGFLNGHFLDFYDYNLTERNSEFYNMVYYPTIYAIFAIWNLPIKLLGYSSIPVGSTLLLYYNRLLCNIFLVLMLLVVKKIGCFISKSKEGGLGAVFTLFTMPCFFIASIFWGIYDSIYMTAVLWGVYLIYRNKRYDWAAAILLFGLSITIKSIVLFLVTPLLLFRCKSLPKLAASFIGLLLPMGIEAAVFFNSPTFKELILFPQGVFIGQFSATQFSEGWGGGYTSVYLVAFLVICFLAYTTPYDEQKPERMIYIAFANMALYFILCSWVNQQWVLMLLPFYALLLIGANRELRGQLYALNAVFAVGFIGKIIGVFFNFSEECFASGLFGRLVLDPSILNSPTNEANLFYSAAETYFTRLIYSNNYVMVYSSLFAAVLICALISLNPWRKKLDYGKTLFSTGAGIEREKRFMYLYLLLGLSAYLLPTALWVIQNRR